MESHSRNTLMTGPALAKPCCHSIVLSCTSILETWPKNPPAAGQSPPGPQAEKGEQCGTAPVPPCKLLKGPCLLGCIGRQLRGEWQ